MAIIACRHCLGHTGRLRTRPNTPPLSASAQQQVNQYPEKYGEDQFAHRSR